MGKKTWLINLWIIPYYILFRQTKTGRSWGFLWIFCEWEEPSFFLVLRKNHQFSSCWINHAAGNYAGNIWEPGCNSVLLPSGKRLHNYGKSPFFNGKIHYKWSFSIAMLNYQRVTTQCRLIWDSMTHCKGASGETLVHSLLKLRGYDGWVSWIMKGTKTWVEFGVHRRIATICNSHHHLHRGHLLSHARTINPTCGLCSKFTRSWFRWIWVNHCDHWTLKNDIIHKRPWTSMEPEIGSLCLIPPSQNIPKPMARSVWSWLIAPAQSLHHFLNPSTRHPQVQLPDHPW